MFLYADMGLLMEHGLIQAEISFLPEKNSRSIV